MDDAAEIGRRRDELLSELAVLSEALRRLVEVEEEADRFVEHVSQPPSATADDGGGGLQLAGGDDGAAGSLLSQQGNDNPVAVVAAADGHQGAPDDLYPLGDATFDDAPVADDDDGGDTSGDEAEHSMHPQWEHRLHGGQAAEYGASFGPEFTPVRRSDGGFGGVPASAAAIDSLKKQRYDGTGADSGCVICVREFKKGRRLYVMPCESGHRFHRRCLEMWLKSSNACPLCRYALPTDTE